MCFDPVQNLDDLGDVGFRAAILNDRVQSAKLLEPLVQLFGTGQCALVVVVGHYLVVHQGDALTHCLARHSRVRPIQLQVRRGHERSHQNVVIRSGALG